MMMQSDSHYSIFVRVYWLSERWRTKSWLIYSTWKMGGNHHIHPFCGRLSGSRYIFTLTCRFHEYESFIFPMFWCSSKAVSEISPGNNFFLLRKKMPFGPVVTLQGTNISHLGKRKIIFKMQFFGDMLVPWRVYWRVSKKNQRHLPMRGKKHDSHDGKWTLWMDRLSDLQRIRGDPKVTARITMIHGDLSTRRKVSI